MASTWVLIIVLAGSNGYAITSADFNSKYACEVAADEWSKNIVYLTRVTTRCHQK